MVIRFWQQLFTQSRSARRSAAAERVQDSHLLFESMIPILGLYGIGPGYIDPQWLHDEKQ
ncbi:hypothetical protein [Tatumella saanichensis]|uniref:hypothetical protein n=1 Tax=Tatumella saanichensis TaxID=480813 RepID=UPI0004B3D00C|nr:hypothetical protein [Tatumella saanichensis]